MAGITPSGLEIKRLEQIRDSLRQRAEQAFGQPIDPRPRSVFGTLIGVIAQPIALVWSGIQGAYDAFNPSAASGAALENLAAITNVFPIPAQPAVTDVPVLQGDPLLVVPAGTVIRGSWRGVDYDFALTVPVTLDGSGEGVGVWQAAVARSVALPAGIVTNVVTPVVGLDSVSQPSDIIGGRDNETDDELRLRRAESIGLLAGGTDPAILAEVLALPFIAAARVRSNRTRVFVGPRPPNSVSVTVWPAGGSVPMSAANESSLTAAVFRKAPSGIETWGTETFSVTDSQGVTQPVAWSYAQGVDVYVDVRLDVDDTYSGNNAVRQAIIAASSRYSIGNDVFASQLVCAINAVDGVIGVVVTVGDAPAPTGTVQPIGEDEIALFDSGRIAVDPGGV